MNATLPSRDRSRTRSGPAPGAGFTLIELLVVIAVIALIISILLPALGKARRAAALTKESAAIRQVAMAHQAYTIDARDTFMPGYLRGSWADPVKRRFIVHASPNDSSEENRLSGTCIRPYAWRLFPYLNYAPSAIITDPRLLKELSDLPRDQTNPEGYEVAFSRNSSFGLNTTFVGGDAHRGGFYLPSLLRWGPFYAVRVDQVPVTDRLIVFATSRGVLRGTSGRVVPGYQRIEAPWRATPTSNSIPAFVPWLAPRGRFDPDLPTTAYGRLDFRHSGKVLASMVDGHVDTFFIDQLYDMRRWSPRATKPEWRP